MCDTDRRAELTARATAGVQGICLPGHVNLVLEEDVIEGGLQICLVADVTFVIVAIHLQRCMFEAPDE